MPYQNLDELKSEIVTLWESGKYSSIADLTRHIIAEHGDFGREQDSLRRSVSKIIQDSEPDKELLVENVRLAKDKQRLQDVQRIERKAFREDVRVENAVAQFGKELANQNKLHAKKLIENINIKPLEYSADKHGVGVIQITDVHANELIDLPHNQYNWTVLSKRMKKLINESLRYFAFRNVEKVIMVYTGDLCNSDRRLDELLNQSTNRAKAANLLAHIITQSILEVRNAGYEVGIVSVLGNESRVKQEMTFSNEAFSDNYDYTIMAQVKQVLEFANIQGIMFHSIDKMENVIDFGEQKWLVMHDMPQSTSKQEKTQSIIGKYALSGKPVDFVISGHIHAHRGTDISCRSGSMSGSNTFNEHALGLIGRASGVCYVVDGKERYYQYIDLQYADNEGYGIVKELEAYNIKSELKTRQQTAIFQVVI
ncbi:hypothetical protein [uncultured Dysgonomonas sp.]|uniref:Calcineurin-like phosphoesterase domain-containing protein n=1 Tax=uncultured Dysgonomonas sp. TaxID=206096 RepID=A0A212IXT4_9BACT|nr:hypothetical protein [uncultured Dysgonomonas sp.]SBV91990.1 hypothetical protein KL86DYS1_10488 [uncultured Dysgonomonas sp.]